MQLQSKENSQPMYQNNTETNQLKSNLATSQELPVENDSRVRVSPCEFELLLQRAAEILNAGTRIAAASHS